MREIKTTKQFRKDLKRIQNNPKRIANVKKVLSLLAQNTMLPEEYYQHKLVGNYKGCWECHIESDVLLVWIDEEEHIVKLMRLGSHSELF